MLDFSKNNKDWLTGLTGIANFFDIQSDEE